MRLRSFLRVGRLRILLHERRVFLDRLLRVALVAHRVLHLVVVGRANDVVGERGIVGAGMHGRVAASRQNRIVVHAGLVVGVGGERQGPAGVRLRGIVRERIVALEILELLGRVLVRAVGHHGVGVRIHFLGRVGVFEARGLLATEHRTATERSRGYEGKQSQRGRRHQTPPETGAACLLTLHDPEPQTIPLGTCMRLPCRASCRKTASHFSGSTHVSALSCFYRKTFAFELLLCHASYRKTASHFSGSIRLCFVMLLIGKPLRTFPEAL